MRIALFIFSLAILSLSTAYAADISLSGYWQNFENPAQMPVRLTEIPKAYKIINIAFADMANDGSVTFNLQGPPYTAIANGSEQFKQDIKTLQQQNKKVILSLGGQNAYYQINSYEQENRFIKTVTTLIKTYGFDGLDYDFESGLTYANASFLLDATKKLKANFLAEGKTLSFSLAPETIDVYWQVYPYGKYDQLIQADVIDTIQVQLYNSGCMPGSNANSACYTQGTEDFIVSQVDSTIQVWNKNGVKNPGKKYAIGLPATINAAGGGYADASVISKSLSCLRTKTNCDHYIPEQIYSDLNQLMTWSINWDAKNNYAFAKLAE